MKLLAVLVAALTAVVVRRCDAFDPSDNRVDNNRLDEDDEEVLITTTPSLLRCPPCNQIHCSPKKSSRLKCRGGIASGVCNCCPVCAKVEGESCGGHWNYLGTCDKGLYCDLSHNAAFKHQSKVYQVEKGFCRKASEEHQSDQAPALHCRHKCTPEFCLENPKSICSAVDNAEVTRSCQEPCHHTSCRACRFATPETTCGKCGKNDFSCLKKFGKCIRKDACSVRHHFPCKTHTKEESPATKFQCQIPECGG